MLYIDNELNEREGKWTTDLGKWFPGEGVVFHGRSLFKELKGIPWMGIWFYAITGKVYDEKYFSFWSKALAICTSYPDPRIWNNRVAALAGTAKSTANLAVSSANAASEAKQFGVQATIDAYLFIERFCEINKNDLSELIEEELTKYHSVLPGYARPIIHYDERVEELSNLAREHGIDKGPHFLLAHKIDRYLVEEEKDLRLNIAGLSAAIAADQGLNAREFNHFLTAIYAAGFIACYSDAASKKAGYFFPLSVSRIAYRGKPSRKWENPK